MFQLRCTKKMQDLLCLSPPDLFEVDDEYFALGNWYANTFIQDRKKCLLFVEEKTLMSFILTGFREKHLKHFPEMFKHGVAQLLTFEEIEPEIINAFVNAPDELLYTKTDSRQILGNMNDLLWLYQSAISRGGGLGTCNLTNIIMETNRTPQRNLNGNNSVDALREVLHTK